MFNSKAKLTAVFLISALGFIVYFNSLGGQFIRDDNALVKNNIYIKNPANLAKCFTRNIALGSPEKWNSYRPLQMFTYMLDYQIWKLKPAGYHLTNILLHILTGIMLYFFIYAVFGDSILSLYTSLLFIAHPVHTQAVSYISGRADSLAAVFLLFCFILYIRFLGLSTKGTFLFMVISYLGALFSRENSLILPGLLILYHFSLKKKFRASSFSALSCIALIYIVLRLTLLKSLLSNISYPTTFIQRLPGFFAAMAEYFRLIILPFNLHASYGLKLFSFSDPKVIAGIFVTLILVFYALKKRKQDSLILFSIGWFFMALLPQSNLYPINAYMAEHWLYLPSVGFFLIVANFFIRLQRFQRISLAFFIILIGSYSVLTIRQNTYWLKPIGFYQRTLKYSPSDFREYVNLGNSYMAMGNIEQAITSFKKAVELNPDYAQAYNNLGNAYYVQGNSREAFVWYNKAMQLSPDLADLHYNLGNYYVSQGEINKAILSYNKAIELNPDNPKAYNNLGLVYSGLEEFEKAEKMFNKAVTVDPSYGYAYNNLGNLARISGQNKQAIAFYREAIRRSPDYAEAHNNLAIVYFLEQEYDLALKHCDKAVELGYKVNPRILDDLKPYRQTADDRR